MADQRLLDILNRSIARELQVSIQYMWHHVQAVGLESPAVKDIFREIAIVEMKHAERFAERLDLLGGVPTTKPDPIMQGGSLQKMIEDDLKAEQEAVDMYSEAVRIATEVNDPVTRLLYEEILDAEEDHRKIFGDLLKR
ncbi:MAG TPA: ferritin-like domain-containing protein [Chloroflexota bacterium]|nr:ferritin-like domain-containing protein [Chloroflexota bacterium]